MKKKILTVKLSSLGDILLFTPVLEELKKREPNAEIYHLITKSCSIMLKGNPTVEEIIECEDLGVSKNPLNNFNILLKLFFKIKKYRFDEVYIFHRNKILIRFFKLLGIKQIKVWGEEDLKADNIEYFKFDLNEHRIYRHLKLIDKNIELDEKISLRCYLDSFSDYELKLDDYTVIFPGGGNNQWSVMKSRQWSKDNYVNLIKERKGNVVLVGGKTDTEICDYIQKNCSNISEINIINLAGKLKIEDTAKIIRKSNGFIGNDSMPLFLACSYNIPVMGIFCSTEGKVIMPLGKKYIQIFCPEGPCYNPLEGTGNGQAYSCQKLICTKNYYK